MSLFDGALKEEDRVAYMARLLGCSPNHPESWPREVIDNLLRKCPDERTLHETIRKMLTP